MSHSEFDYVVVAADRQVAVLRGGSVKMPFKPSVCLKQVGPMIRYLYEHP